ncbi:TetR/AcrR family transcriptional regulator [Niveibacterium sp. SC-1]|uniref:TetR/AcrR family transcriptional regulator n=1 Tax=Niveibacterium sp. SC-1 TaxID=3135646 RepID=UPI00311FF281
MSSDTRARKQPRQARSLLMVESILEAAARVLAEHGYAGANTNRIAEVAGVSVGSLYQYFPNKDALIAALHERHSRQMLDVMNSTFARTTGADLREQIAALVHANLDAHLLEPALHRVLEGQFPYYDLPNAADGEMVQRVRALLEAHRAAITPGDLNLATWMVMNMMQSLIHACVMEPPRKVSRRRLEAALTDALHGYLTAT